MSNNNELFPADYNPLACPKCGCEDFIREDSYISYLSVVKERNSICFETIDQDYNDVIRPTICCNCGEEVDEYESEQQGRIILRNNEHNIQPYKYGNAIESMKLNTDDIISSI